MADQGDDQVHAQPGETHQHGFGIVKADRHEHGIEENEEGQRCQQQTQVSGSGPAFEEQAGNQKCDDEQGQQEYQVGDRREAREREVQDQPHDVNPHPQRQGVAPPGRPVAFPEQEVPLKQQGGRQVQHQGDGEDDEAGGGHDSPSSGFLWPSRLKRRRTVSR